MQKNIILVLKFYAFSLLFSFIVAFFGFALELSTQYISILVAVFILSGLIYHHIKDRKSVVMLADVISISVGIALPAIVMFIFFPIQVGLGYLSYSTKFYYIAMCLSVNFIVTFGLAKLSQSIQSGAVQNES